MGKRKSNGRLSPVNKKPRYNDDFDDNHDLMARAMEMQNDISNSSGSESNDEPGSTLAASDDVEEFADEDAVSDDEDEWKTVPASSKGKEIGSGKSLDVEATDVDFLSKRSIKPSLDKFITSLKYPSLSSKKMLAVVELLTKIQDIIAKTPAIKPMSVQDAVKYMQKQNIHIPFPVPAPVPSEVQWKLAYDSPSSVRIAGLVNAGLVGKSSLGHSRDLDLLVEMPASMFSEKDIKDYRYFHKRAFYLAAIAFSLQNANLPALLSFNYLENDELRPCLELHSLQDGSEADFSSRKLIIRILPVLSHTSSPFELQKLAPSRCNVRSGNQSPTPLYNTSLLLDLVAADHQSYLSTLSQSIPAFSEACILLQAFAETRALSLHHYGLQRFLLFLLAYLTTGDNAIGKSQPILPAGSSAWMLFKGTLDFLARTDLINGFFACKRIISTMHKYFITAAESPVPAFVDPSGCINLLAGMSSPFLNLLRMECRTALTALEGDTPAGFDSVFLRTISNQTRYDASAAFEVSPAIIQKWTQYSGDGHHPSTQFVHAVFNDLSRALSNRAKAISVTSNQSASWSLAVNRSKTAAPLTVSIGLFLDQTHAGRIVDHGPPAEEEEACAEFRTFWGSKSELRRFKDGSITESVVWQANTPSARSAIVGQVVIHILQARFGIKSSHISTLVTPFDAFIAEQESTRKQLYQADPVLSGYTGILEAFEELSSTLRTLEGVPLSIKAIQPSSELLRYSSTFTPGPRKTKHYSSHPDSTRFVPMADFVISFESSAKWPSDLEAIQKIKAAFLMRMSELLQEKMPSAQCRVAFDILTDHRSDNVALELILSNGYAFRARIYHDGEKEAIAALPVDETNSAQMLLKDYQTRFTAKPKHHAAIAALQHTFTPLGPTMRLVKRWFRCHMLSPFFQPEILELIAVFAFVNRYDGVPIPASGASGLLRVLYTLSEWDWQHQPFLVPLYEAIGDDTDLSRGRKPVIDTDKTRRALQTFQVTRKNDPAMKQGRAMWLSTSEDLSSQAWGAQAITPLIAGRVSQLSRAALEAVETGMHKKNFNAVTIFGTPLNDYDFLVHLDPFKLTRYHEALSPNTTILHQKPSTSSKFASVLPTPPISLSFDPAAAFVGELQKLAGDAVVLFHDLHGGRVVGGLFDPSLSKTHDFRVQAHTLPYTHMSTDNKSKSKVQFSRQAFLNEIARVGGDLVKSVELVKKAV